MDIRNYFSRPSASKSTSVDASSTPIDRNQDPQLTTHSSEQNQKYQEITSTPAPSSCKESASQAECGEGGASSSFTATDALEQKHKQSSQEVFLSPSKVARNLSTLPEEPHQPPVSCIPAQKLQNKTLKFQKRWFNEFPWLHFDESIGGVLCHTCVSASQQKLSDLARCAEDTFLRSGFVNWKKGTEKFRNHEKSMAHKISFENLKLHKHQEGINAQLSTQLLHDQRQSRAALLKLITTLKYLAEQGLAIRGHEASEGNFARLLQLRAEDDQNLKAWLSRKVSFTSGKVQNEILKIMGNAVVRDICSDVNRMSTQFGLINDGTQDIAGNEQEAVCVRYVDNTFSVHEELLGLYNVSSTTGMFLSKMLQNTLRALQLPIQNLRAQTYDGATNMSGKYKGCQAEIKKIQPLAMYVHCGAHVTHLIISKAISNSLFMKNALDNIQELGNLYKSSGKFKHLYLNIHTDDADSPSPTRLKPICPTRWLTRYPAVKSVLDNYSNVLDALHDAARELGSTTASRATGLYKCLSSGECVLGLYVSLPLIHCLENFNRALQGKNMTVSGMLEAAEVTMQSLQSLRCDHKFKEMFDAAEQKLQQCDLEAVPLPRKRKIPKRRDYGTAPEYSPYSAEELYRVDFFRVIDAAVSNIKEYFTSTDLIEYRDLSSVLLTGSFKPEILKYPELNESLQQELEFFHHQFKGSSVEDYRKIFTDMVPEVRRMFPQVGTLVRLLLVSPASSCTAERSFSALRRMKTWLRSTMTQQRLNHLMICHVHSDRLAALSPQKIAEEFIRSEDRRRQIFGRF